MHVSVFPIWIKISFLEFGNYVDIIIRLHQDTVLYYMEWTFITGSCLESSEHRINTLRASHKMNSAFPTFLASPEAMGDLDAQNSLVGILEQLLKLE